MTRRRMQGLCHSVRAAFHANSTTLLVVTPRNSNWCVGLGRVPDMYQV